MPSRGPRRAREHFLAGDATDLLGVRAEIEASWVRSRDLAVDTERIDPSYADRSGSGAHFAAVAAPILKSFAAELAGEPIAILLTDASGVVLMREATDPSLLRQLDGAQLSPGFGYAEASVGTNGIGTAIEMRSPTMVIGFEHYNEALGVFACAGATVYHPVTGALMGVVDLTCAAGYANPMMLTFAKVIAQRITEQLLSEVSAREMALMSDYLSTCHHTGGAVLALSDDLVMMNTHTQRRYDSADQTALLITVGDATGSTKPLTLLTDLPSGSTARLEYRPAFAGEILAGGVVRVLSHVTPEQRRRSLRPARLTVLPGVVGTSATWQRVCQTVLDSRQRGEWLVLEGEPGVGKLTLLQGAQLATNPGGHFRVIDAADAVDPARFESIAEELQGGDTLVVQHVQLLTPEAVDALADLLLELASIDAGGSGPWVAMTLSSEVRNPDVDAQLLPHFPHSVSVPPLRHHMDDLARLVPHLLSTISRERELVMSLTAMNRLMRLPWPGNVEHLRRILVQVAKARRTGSISVDDLPVECRATSRHQLTAMEALERDAITSALVSHRGNKLRAAEALGMSRATVYRKIKDYGIFTY